MSALNRRWWPLAALVALAAWAWWASPPSATDIARQVQAELLEPYALQIAAGDPAGARARWTSSEYRAEVSEIVYLAGQARNDDELGAPRTLRWDGGAPEVGGRGRLTLPGEVRGPRGALSVVVEVVAEDGEWRVDRTWTRPLGGVGVERVF